VRLTLRYDLRAPEWGSPPADLYAAALDQCAWADRAGFYRVRFLEHHGSPDGYLPSPLIAAAAAAARTTRIRIAVRALIITLHDPVRVAEDAAVVDLISRGRLDLVVAAGYVPSEFAMFDRDMRRRGELLEEAVNVLKEAWEGQPFTYRGRPCRVATRPYRRPRIVLGGSSVAAAQRAARIADGFEPTHWRLYDDYAAECARLGNTPGPPLPRRPGGQFLYVAEDVSLAWEELGPHLLHEANSYSSWLAESDKRLGALYEPAATVDELRATGKYLIVTAEECVELASGLGRDGELEFHPLAGGLSPALGWRSLRLVEEKVMPALRAMGMLGEPERYAGE
jgi:alkanesulfonate monooxygenase SsuD/methylene tetrahydromethanopterin reductase-like flavin-dependent oxidoreductase (luciferase family)